MNLIFKLSISFFAFAFVSCVYAQVPSSIDGVTINLSSNNPKPGDSVEIYVESYSMDLNSASIIWAVNGKNQNQGIGMKKTSVIAPKAGIKMTVSSIIKTIDGREIRKTITIKTGSVDIIWETGGYSHPFFKGKKSFVYQNKLRLIAIPHLSKDGVKEIDPKTLVYSWKRDGKYIENGQGYGKQYVEITGDDIPKNVDVSVEVYNREQTERSSESISLNPSEPSLSFYEEDSLYGILFNKSITRQSSIKNREMRVLAVPFGFNMNVNTNRYVWSINNIEQSDLLKNRSITIRTKSGTAGSSNIALDIRNNNEILQGARGEFTLYFNRKSDEDIESTNQTTP